MKMSVNKLRCLLHVSLLVVTLSPLTVAVNVCGSFTFHQGVSDLTVTVAENSMVTIRFSLDTTDCDFGNRQNDDSYVTVSGPHNTIDGDYCLLRLTQQTCSSVFENRCRCDDRDGEGVGEAVFMKNVTGRDRGSWVWRYNNGHSTNVVDFRITGPTTTPIDVSTTSPILPTLLPHITATVMTRGGQTWVQFNCTWETGKRGKSQDPPDHSQVQLLDARGVAMDTVQRMDGLVTAELSVDCGSHGNVTCVLPGGGRSSAWFEVDAGQCSTTTKTTDDATTTTATQAITGVTALLMTTTGNHSNNSSSDSSGNKSDSRIAATDRDTSSVTFALTFVGLSLFTTVVVFLVIIIVVPKCSRPGGTHDDARILFTSE